jgi:hypothetical protein
MAIHRHDGAAWVPGTALYTIYEPNVHGGGPAIWVRARRVWCRTADGWQPATAGSEPAADLTAEALTIARSEDGGRVIEPDSNDPSLSWESSLKVTAGPGCAAFAVWHRHTSDQPMVWRFYGSYTIQQGQPRELAIPTDAMELRHWCVTAWGPSLVTLDSLPVGQQGYSRFVFD